MFLEKVPVFYFLEQTHSVWKLLARLFVGVFHFEEKMVDVADHLFQVGVLVDLRPLVKIESRKKFNRPFWAGGEFGRVSSLVVDVLQVGPKLALHFGGGLGPPLETVVVFCG